MSQVDLVAEALKLDPLSVRVKNAITLRSKTHFGQTLDEHVDDELELLKPHYEDCRVTTSRAAFDSERLGDPALV